MPSAITKLLQRIDGFRQGDGVRDSSVYLENHTLTADVIGQGIPDPALLVRGLDTRNAPTDLLRVSKQGGLAVAGLAVSGDASVGGGLAVAGALTVAGVDVGAALAAPRLNLLTNPGVEIWQRGTGPFTATSAFTADRWQMTFTGTSMTVNREGTTVDGTYGGRYSLSCAYVQASGGQKAAIYQVLEEGLAYRNRPLAFGARVLTATAGVVRLGIYDGTTWQYASAYHTGGSTWQTLTFTYPIPGTANIVQVGVWIEGTATVYVDNATVVIGSVAADYQPLAPAEDLARCLRYYQTWGGSHLFEWVAGGMCYSTTHAQVILPFQAPMAGVPTVTFAPGAGSFILYNAAASPVTVTALSPGNQGTRSCSIDATVAAGLTGGNATVLATNNSLAARAALEFNP